MNYTDTSSDNNYPKTLVIRNHRDGAIWQVYHIQNEKEAERLSNNAHKNGFLEITLEDYRPELQETWPDWRDTEGGKQITSL